MIIYAAPPGLPLVLLVIGAAARKQLTKDGLKLMFPEIIKRGALVDVVCFDKTGTLTDSKVKSSSCMTASLWLLTVHGTRTRSF